MMPRFRSAAAAPRPWCGYLLRGPPPEPLSGDGTHALSTTCLVQKG
jgi:hypothetical protein